MNREIKMTDNTKIFTFTAEQIERIYRAGIDRGTDEQSSFEWGSHCNGKWSDNMVAAICDIMNEGKEWENHISSSQSR